MARFLFSAWPLAGHVAPVLSVARAVRARGHEVAFYTGASACPEVAEAGIDAFPFVQLSEERARAAVVAIDEAPGGLRSSSRVIRAFRGWIVGTVPEQVADLRDVIDRWRPDVLVSDQSMWGPILVLWEATGLPT